jgi:hypothetical protein
MNATSISKEKCSKIAASILDATGKVDIVI